jgi:hypothetical protein
MHRFWNEQVAAQPTERGVAVSLPLMYPDGLQVQVHLDQVAPAAAVVSISTRSLSTGRLTRLFRTATDAQSRTESIPADSPFMLLPAGCES